MAEKDLGKILLTQADIERRVMELGKEISLFYRAEPVTVVGVLKGAVFFLADLVRQIESPLTYDFFQAESYGLDTASSGIPRLTLTTKTPLGDRHVLLVEDIIDTGFTLKLVREAVLLEKPRSLRTCVLLDKKDRRQTDVPLDWVGFPIPNRFVVGYGLDYRERYRNLPYLAFLDEPWERGR